MSFFVTLSKRNKEKYAKFALKYVSEYERVYSAYDKYLTKEITYAQYQEVVHNVSDKVDRLNISTETELFAEFVNNELVRDLFKMLNGDNVILDKDEIELAIERCKAIESTSDDAKNVLEQFKAIEGLDFDTYEVVLFADW